MRNIIIGSFILCSTLISNSAMANFGDEKDYTTVSIEAMNDVLFSSGIDSVENFEHTCESFNSQKDSIIAVYSKFGNTLHCSMNVTNVWDDVGNSEFSVTTTKNTMNITTSMHEVSALGCLNFWNEERQEFLTDDGKLDSNYVETRNSISSKNGKFYMRVAYEDKKDTCNIFYQVKK